MSFVPGNSDDGLSVVLALNGRVTLLPLGMGSLAEPVLEAFSSHSAWELEAGVLANTDQT